jgi:glycosyltransferase involved in cell wall biosynthesis
MKKLKFELVIAYYRRPLIVLNALNSIKNSSYKNWKLTLIDDSGDDSFKQVFFNYGLDNSKIDYIATMMSDEEKIKIGGTIFGKYINDIIINSDSDIFILICDDDALNHDYLEKLNKYYLSNPNEVWSYCHLNFFDPNSETYVNSTSVPKLPYLNPVNLNAFNYPIPPSCRVDSSQVTFRIKSMIEKQVFYPSPQTHDHDRTVFEDFYSKWGLCPFNGIVGQCKGWFNDQLGVRIRSNRGHFLN